MHKLGFAAALSIATLSTAAIAADWVLVSENDAGGTYYIDRESIRTMPSGYKRAWVRVYLRKKLDAGVDGARSLKEFDCREGRDRFLQSAFFKGEEIMATDNDISGWNYVAPDTSGESMLNYVCFGKLD